MSNKCPLCVERQKRVALLESLLREAYEHLECFDAKEHNANKCLDRRIKIVLGDSNATSVNVPGPWDGHNE